MPHEKAYVFTVDVEQEDDGRWCALVRQSRMLRLGFQAQRGTARFGNQCPST